MPAAPLRKRHGGHQVNALQGQVALALATLFFLTLSAINSTSTTAQVIAFGLIPSLVALVPRHLPDVDNLATLQKSRAITQFAVALSATMFYGLASYGLGLSKLLPLTVAILAGVMVATPAKSRAVVLAPPLVLAIGEAIAGTGSRNSTIVAATTCIAWSLLLVGRSAIENLCLIRNTLLAALLVIVAAFFAGVRRPYETFYLFNLDQVESRGGLTNFRWYLPFSSGWEPPAILAVILSLVSLALLLVQKKGAILSILGFSLGLIVNFGVNGRTAQLALLGGILVLLIGYFRPRLRPFFLGACYVPVFLPLLSSLFTAVLQPFSQSLVDAGFGESVTKLISLEGRTQIWQVSLSSFAQAAPVRKIFGFGADGFIDSGASRIYSQSISSTLGQSGYRSGLYDTHNLMLELLLSQGIPALILLCIFMGAIIRRIRLMTDSQWLVPFIGMWTFAVMSSTSTACLPSNATYGVLCISMMLSPLLLKVPSRPAMEYSTSEDNPNPHAPALRKN